jgi:hypothetical protein
MKPEPLAVAACTFEIVNPSKEKEATIGVTKATPKPSRMSVRRLVSSIPLRACSFLLLSIISASPRPISFSNNGLKADSVQAAFGHFRLIHRRCDLPATA